jgi:hypothetical protein
MRNAREPRLRIDSRGAGPSRSEPSAPQGAIGAAVRGSPWWRQRTPGASVHCSRGEPGSNAHAGGIRPGRDTERPALWESGRPDPSLFRHLRVAGSGPVFHRLAGGIRPDTGPTGRGVLLPRQRPMIRARELAILWGRSGVAVFDRPSGRRCRRMPTTGGSAELRPVGGTSEGNQAQGGSGLVASATVRWGRGPDDGARPRSRGRRRDSSRNDVPTAGRQRPG